MAKNQQDLLNEIAELQQEVAAPELPAQEAAQEAVSIPDLIMVLPTDTWESIAARFGVTVEQLFSANQGVGGCTTMQSIPVGARLVRPE